MQYFYLLQTLMDEHYFTDQALHFTDQALRQ